MKIKAYLVIEKVEYENYIHCFPFNPKGLAAAKRCFVAIAKDQNGYFSQVEIKTGLKEEVLSNESGTWSLSLQESE